MDENKRKLGRKCFWDYYPGFHPIPMFTTKTIKHKIASTHALAETFALDKRDSLKSRADNGN